MGEGYAAIQIGVRAACSGGCGQSDDSYHPRKAFKYVMASEPGTPDI